MKATRIAEPIRPKRLHGEGPMGQEGRLSGGMCATRDATHLLTTIPLPGMCVFQAKTCYIN